VAWKFDQKPNVACITCSSVITGAPVLVVTHYQDDHSWAFLDGQTFSTEDALVVAMSSVIDLHPDLAEIADLPPGWTATRNGQITPWSRFENE
jgi:hypothetical protein